MSKIFVNPNDLNIWVKNFGWINFDNFKYLTELCLIWIDCKSELSSSRMDERLSGIMMALALELIDGKLIEMSLMSPPSSLISPPSFTGSSRPTRTGPVPSVLLGDTTLGPRLEIRLRISVLLSIWGSLAHSVIVGLKG